MNSLIMAVVTETMLYVRGPGFLHYHRGQTDVSVNLQGGNVLDRSETMFIGVCLHTIGHNPEGVTLTTDSQL